MVSAKRKFLICIFATKYTYVEYGWQNMICKYISKRESLLNMPIDQNENCTFRNNKVRFLHIKFNKPLENF